MFFNLFVVESGRSVQGEVDAGGDFVKIESEDLNTWVYELNEGTTGRPQDWQVGPKVD